jgi:rhodanese-related sulfurtransferase
MKAIVHLLAASIALLPAGFLAGCSQEKSVAGPEPSYIEVSVAEAETLILSTPDLIVLDASPYYAEAHIPGATPYPVRNGSLSEGLHLLDPDATYLVYAHLGDTSVQAAEAMIAAGFAHVYRLEGDFTAWIRAGLPISVPTPP